MTIKQGTLDLLASERGTLCMLLVIASTLLVVTGYLTAEQWLTYTQWICVTLVASKTITGAIQHMKAPGEPIPAARVVSEAPPSA